MSDTIKDLILKMVKDATPIMCEVCNVDSVNEEARTCTLSPKSGDAKLYNARLSATLESHNGFVLIPKVGSDVMVLYFQRDAAIIVMCTDLDKIIINTAETIFNDGMLGGLVKVQELVTRMNTIENAINTFWASYNLHVHATAALGVPSPPIPPQTTTLIPTTVAQLENDKIKQ